jgi:hypothetical protein
MLSTEIDTTVYNDGIFVLEMINNCNLIKKKIFILYDINTKKYLIKVKTNEIYDNKNYQEINRVTIETFTSRKKSNILQTMTTMSSINNIMLDCTLYNYRNLILDEDISYNIFENCDRVVVKNSDNTEIKLEQLNTSNLETMKEILQFLKRLNRVKFNMLTYFKLN